MLFSVVSLSAMHWRVGMSPRVGTYLVWPSCMALMAASLMGWGVSKSGSPAANPRMSIPLALRALARLLSATVIEGLRLETRCERDN